MKKSKFIFLIFISLILGLFLSGTILGPQKQVSFAAEEKDLIEINFFYGATCPHCTQEEIFLEKIEQRYTKVKINSYLITDSQSVEILKQLCEKCEEAGKYIGLVPLTFINDDFFLGFDNDENIGRDIENSIRKQLGYPLFPKKGGPITLPLLGEINIGSYSLPLQAVILGFFDGFNVCSLGALILILGLVLALRSRIKILIFGGMFIVISAIIYGFLILLWYQLFSLLSSYMKAMQVLMGLLGIGGGIYFLREFIKFRKRGPVCETDTGGVVSKLSSRMQEFMKNPRNPLIMLGGIVLFAAVITIVEFPCSAVVPVFFAGILAESQLSTFHYLLYIGIFVFFYMLDEIIIFLIAFFTMSLWFASKKFITWITLLEAIMFFLFGFYYLIGF